MRKRSRLAVRTCRARPAAIILFAGPGVYHALDMVPSSSCSHTTFLIPVPLIHEVG